MPFFILDIKRFFIIILITNKKGHKMKIEHKTIYNVYGKIKYYNHKTMKNEIITTKDSYFIVFYEFFTCI